MLDLIQDCSPFQSCDESGDVSARGGECRSVIESVVPIASAASYLLSQSGFAAFARAVDQNNGCVREEGGFRESSI
jgi:hypothetical protein